MILRCGSGCERERRVTVDCKIILEMRNAWIKPGVFAARERRETCRNLVI